ncbi:MAG: DNA internalization-related competence protein ComEC/Rec2 [Ignavibacteria bacterium]|nr:DNA internalization-related competence protein ComEC/Rec2 [Ignavibacteria bacterium]
MIKLENIPAVKVAVFMIIGIIIGYYFNTGIFIVTAGLIIILLIILSVKKIRLLNYSIYILYFLIILTGFFKINYDTCLKPSNSIAFIQDTDRDRDVFVTGIVKEPPEIDLGKVKFLLSTEVAGQSDEQIPVSGNIIVYMNPDMKIDSGKTVPAVNAGDEIKIYGKLRTAPGERNPGEFNYHRYLNLNGIEKIFYSKGYENLEVLSSGNLNFILQNIIYPSRVYALNVVDRQIGGEEGSYLKGLLTGSKTTMSEELKDNFVKAGVMHLIAVSGLNVAYVILFSMMFFSIFRMKREYRYIITIIFIIYYCLFTGAQPSIVRATILGVLVILAWLIQKRIVFLNLIGASAIIVFIIDSRQLFDAGFILSYSATISMVLFFQKTQSIIQPLFFKKRSVVRRICYYFVILFLSTFAAQIGTLPLTSLYFGKISLISFISNLIAVPISNISLALGMLQVITAPLFGFISESIAEVNYLLLKMQIIMINFFGELEFAYTVKYNFDTMSMIIYFIIVAVIYSVTMNNYRFRIVLVLFLILLFIMFSYQVDPQIRIVFFDVGQGDAALVTTPSGKNILIDAGLKNDATDKAKRHIAPYLERNRISDIDLLILTHHHYDHSGGAVYLLENFNIKKIIFNDINIYDRNFKIIEDIIIRRRIERENLYAGDVINIGEDVKFYCLLPKKSDVNYISNNDDCIVLKMKYKEFDILFTSDINADEEQELVRNYGSFLNSDILKVAHHGSKNSSSSEFLAESNPLYSVLSCGYLNHFNHPSPLTIEKLKAAGSIVCRTDLEGAIVFESDGYELRRIIW